jgi:tripartite-type tricarboxylate transporter receptor subunit TctC
MLKLSVLLALVVVMATGAAAQDWPSRPVRFIVPFPAGGSTDVGARLVGEYLSRSLRQQIVVENKSGANGNIGIETAAKSPPDGYTVLVTTDAVSSNPHVYKMNIDPLKSLTPIIQLARQPMVLAAHPSLGVVSLAELIALAKRQPGLRYATGSGVGAQHMVAQWFVDRRYQAGAGALSWRSAGAQRSHRRARETRIARLDATDPTLQGRHATAPRTIHREALAQPTGGADLSRSRN